MTPPLNKRRAQVRSLLETDLSYGAIAERVGLSRARVGQIAKQEHARDLAQQLAEEDTTRPLLERRIEWLPWSTRTRNCLTHHAAITTVSDLLRLEDRDLLKIKNLGRRTLDEIRDWKIAHGLMTATVPQWRAVKRCPFCAGTGRLAV